MFVLHAIYKSSITTLNQETGRWERDAIPLAYFSSNRKALDYVKESKLKIKRNGRIYKSRSLLKHAVGFSIIPFTGNGLSLDPKV